MSTIIDNTLLGEDGQVKESSAKPSEVKTSGPILLETKQLEEHYDSKGYTFIVEAGAAPPKDDEDKWSNYVLTYTRHFDEEHDRFTYSNIEIKSQPLKRILKRIIKYYPGESFATEKVELSLPSEVLLHYRKELWNVYEDKVGDEEGRSHLKFLLEWYEKEENELIKQYENLIAQGLITYRLLWTIMKPGCTIYAPLHGQPRAFTLKSSYQSKCFYVLEASYTDFDGRKFGTADTQFQIWPFVGSAAINSLTAYPLSWHARESSVRETLIKRGRIFESFQGKHYMEYSGLALGPIINKKRVRFSINGRVMVDAETFGRMQTDRCISVDSFKKKRLVVAGDEDDDGKEDDEDEDDDNDEEEDSGYDSDFGEASGTTGKRPPRPLTDEQCLHATNLVCGFAFNEKEWVEFYIDKLTPIRWNGDAFNQLVLPEKQKNLVRALVQSHIRDTDDGGFDDVIKGKGKGLISVLHGPPGVGKTLTAESVAEFTKRPLYAVSSGELGTTPSALEHNLSRILDVATVWKAVLLLDEADVFLEKRSLHDVNRNALVSIFLRLLEYYQGILLLTTNRVESFDEAFQSRIHVALKYNDLTPESRRAVWKNFLSRLGGDRVDIDENEYETLQGYAMNGRQIKNAVKTAKSLADFNGQKIGLETVETVLDIQRDFQRDFRQGREV
ncbi:hypothetical protein GYMLUDRAFT_208901 [Collybiopsis luxurians FD-317 M1]|uniref:AAA+ ATPase domain-containing protein n=1 Tax=Collybiopsis luxurians FD-317 M1 TaxID=944289 RepID=A0A0D0BNN3_9AGAR|nr:hypothetical protein GYMLUDRAFT_208901 [Collybiopsis luxurians FD-317 M1]